MHAPAYNFSEEIYASHSQLPDADRRLGERMVFVRLVRERPSPMFVAAAESIEAGVSLLALRNVSQALLLLTQAAEVSLKGLVHEIKLLGVRTWAAQNPAFMRNRAKSGASSNFDDSHFKKIIGESTFITSFREVSEFLGFSNSTISFVRGINNVRNEIAHQGGDVARYNFYLGQILFGVLPLLDEIYSKALGLSLCDLIYHPVSRELVVAGRYMRSKKNHTSKDWSKALRAMHFAYFGTIEIMRGASPSEDCDLSEFERQRQHEKQVEREFYKSTKGSILSHLHTDCKICGERCFVSTDCQKKEDSQGMYCDIMAISCPYCHLEILDADAELARLHYGPLNKISLGVEDWDNLVNDLD